MSSDDSSRVGSRKFVSAGIGLHMTWYCMGCQQHRRVLGSKGRGLGKRCAECTAKRKEKNEQLQADVGVTSGP
jgi:hypothetical protein